jgi:hypothetical protein
MTDDVGQLGWVFTLEDEFEAENSTSDSNVDQI